MSIPIGNLPELGQAIRRARDRAGLDLQDLARESGVAADLLREIEQGSGQVDMGVLFQVLDALNLSLLLEAPLGARPATGSVFKDIPISFPGADEEE